MAPPVVTPAIALATSVEASADGTLVATVPLKLTVALVPVTETAVTWAWKPNAEMETMSPMLGTYILGRGGACAGLIRLRTSELLVGVGVVM